jgi:two-component system chemotaxis response regulator CheY
MARANSLAMSRINPIFKQRGASFTACQGRGVLWGDPARIFQADTPIGPAHLTRARSRAMPLDWSISVLIVDDASTMAHIIRNLLRQIGFKDVDEAHGGATALAKMRIKRYGLVISDWNMEPMTGIDLLRQVRADPSLGEIPFIMVTAESRREHVIAAKEAGASNYIVKPFNAQLLKAKIESVLAENAPLVLGSEH